MLPNDRPTPHPSNIDPVLWGLLGLNDLTLVFVSFLLLGVSPPSVYSDAYSSIYKSSHSNAIIYQDF